MSDDRSRDLVTYARELEQRDAEIAARIELAAGLLRQVDGVRARARRVAVGLEAIPGEVEQAELAERDAVAREAEAQRELADAERELDQVGRSRRAGEEARAAAERSVWRAAVAVTDAAAAVTRTRERLQAFGRNEIALRAEAEGLAVEAQELSRAVAAVPRLSESGRAAPGPALAEIEEWGARAHAALFVVRGGLENERERIVLEADTLAAAALGEEMGGSSVTLVRKRLERSLS